MFVMSRSSSDPPSCCSATSARLNINHALVLSVPIVFTFILLFFFFFFYFFYLRGRRVDWSNNNDISRTELGLKKGVREMLPIIVYKESFFIRDTLCSVCLGDYQAEDRLQQIPSCGHTFHIDCIDHWLTTHTTCPLCRFSLLASAKPSTESPDVQAETGQGPPNVGNSDETFLQSGTQASEETQIELQFSELMTRGISDERNLHPSARGVESSNQMS